MNTSQMIEVARDVAHRVRERVDGITVDRSIDDDLRRLALPLVVATSSATPEQMAEVERYLYEAIGERARPLREWFSRPWDDAYDLGDDNSLATGALSGAVFTSIHGMTAGSDEVILRASWWSLRLWHEQDCCEAVWLEDVTGDPADLVGVPVQIATACNHDDDPDTCESRTWTFYHLRSPKGDVTLRWCGESSGYYSEEVHWQIVPNQEATR